MKAFSCRRVKNDERDAADLADLLRMGRLPEAWIAPPATRELRELAAATGAKLVRAAVNLGQVTRSTPSSPPLGVPVAHARPLRRGTGSSLAGRPLGLPRRRTRARIASLRRLAAPRWTGEVDPARHGCSPAGCAGHAGYARDPAAVPAIGPVLAAVVRRRDRRHHAGSTGPGAAGLAGPG